MAGLRRRRRRRSARIEKSGMGEAVKIGASLPMPIFRRLQILRFLLTAVMRTPKLTIALALFVLAALAGTLTYAAYLLVGVLAEYLGTGRGSAGLLLGVLLARFPWISRSGLRIVGLLPGAARRPLMVSLLALAMLHFLVRGDYVPAGFTGFAAAFVLTFPWLRGMIFGRVSSSFFKFTGQDLRKSRDDTVIEGEFRERKD